jgi:Kelch motif
MEPGAWVLPGTAPTRGPMSVGALAFLVLSTILSPLQVRAYWLPGPDMPAPGTGQVAVQLLDGRALVLGGEDVTDGFPVATTELFNPVTGQWIYGPDMNVGRIGATATTLPNGRVLVVGGLGPKLNALNSAEFFDPSSMTWTETAPMPGTRFGQSATLLPNGQVLLVGGIVDGFISSSTLFFDPDTGLWLPAPPSRYPHAQHTALVLPGGSILIAGGYGKPETYDPARGRWQPIIATPFRSHPVVNELHDGTVLLASGVGARARDLRTARVYSPTSGAWRQVGSLRTARNQATGSILPNGTVLVAGGEQVTVHVLRSAEIFHPARGTWTETAPMRVPRDAAVALPLPDGTIMVCGGMNLTGVLSSCEVYHA